MNKMKPFSTFKYVVILSVAMVLVTFSVGISYYMTVRNLERNQEQANLRSILQLKNIVDERLNKLNYIVNNLGTYYQTYYILNMPSTWKISGSSNMITAKEYMEYIDTLLFSTDLVAEISVYSQNSGHVFTAKGIKDFDRWYTDSFSSLSDSVDTWTENVNSLVPQKLMKERIYFDNGIPVTVIPYIQKLPLGSKKQANGYICLLIKKKSLLDWTSQTHNYDKFYIADSDNTVIASLGRSLPETSTLSIPNDTVQGFFTCILENSRQIVTYAHSANDLSYITLTSHKTVMKDVRYFQNLFLMMVTVSVIFCALTIIMSIFKIQKPYKRLVADNVHLVSQIRQQENEFRIAVLGRLLSGNIGNVEETVATLHSLSVPVNDKFYCAVKLSIEDEHISHYFAQRKADDYLAAKSHIRKLAGTDHSEDPDGSDSPGRKYILDTDIDSMTLLFETGTDNMESCRQRIADRIQGIQKHLREYGISVFAGGGNFYSITNIHTSYLEASFALKNAMPKESGGVFWYNKQDVVPIFFYPPEIEQKILLNVRCHDADAVEELLDELYRENFLRLKISDSAAEMFFLKLLSTLLLSFSENSCQKEELHQEIMDFTFLLQTRQQSYSNSFQSLKEFFHSICSLAKENLSMKVLEMQGSILEFINEHCYEQQMSLAFVGNAFHISESYLSVTFKEHNGVNFITYVENRRLEKACELLDQRKKTIDEIAYETGYTSAHSFRRAFKRKYGVSPAQYQKKETNEA